MEPKPFANDTFIQSDIEVKYITEASGALTFEDELTDHCLFAAGVVFTYLHLDKNAWFSQDCPNFCTQL